LVVKNFEITLQLWTYKTQKILDVFFRKNSSQNFVRIFQKTLISCIFTDC